MVRKGFTLIELLAVIVILAIIAIIAAPIVINIINDSKESSGEQTVELYIDAVKKAITRKQLSDSNFNPEECKIQSSGNLLCNDVEVSVDIKGQTPEDGIITLSSNKIYYRGLKLNGKYYSNVIELINDSDSDGRVSIGDKYLYKVNDKYTFIFYILSIEDNQVDLIMDRNICGTEDENNGKPATEMNPCLIAWHANESNNNNGPDTAIKSLYNGTKDWINVPNMQLSYNDEGHETDKNYGYKSIETTKSGIKIIKKDGTEVVQTGNKTPAIPYENNKFLKARLPKKSEMNKTEVKNANGKLKIWLVDNLESHDNCEYETKNNIHGIKGYWLMSSSYGGVGSARLVSSFCNEIDNSTFIDFWYGIRPVITVPREYLES